MRTKDRRKVLHLTVNLLLIASLIFTGWAPIFPRTADVAAQPAPAENVLSPQIPERPASSSYWADVDGDQDVDADDLALVASIWNCQQGQPCYEPGFDRDSDGDIDALDLAAFGNEYDVAPPILEVTTPADNSVVGDSSLTVSDTVSDSHEIS